jgi:alpha-galactosidase
MRDVGYRYVVVDDGWMSPVRDNDGNLVPDRAKFPRGIAYVAERVHRLGLAFGIYTDAGTKTCMGLPASLGYEFRDMRTFASWGVDYVKVDWCHTEGMGPRALYAKWALAVRAAKRPIILSICEWGRSHPWEWAATVGHLWRTCWDIQPTWSSITTVLDRQAALYPFAGPGHWNDPDMLEVGNGDLTREENRAHLAMWAMLAAPLMAGNDLRAMPAAVRDILCAPEVVAVDQDALGEQGRRVANEHDVEVWCRRVGGGQTIVAVLSRAEMAREALFGAAAIGVNGRARMRDLWDRRDMTDFHHEVVVAIQAHSVALLRIAPY